MLNRNLLFRSIAVVAFAGVLLTAILLALSKKDRVTLKEKTEVENSQVWQAPDTSTIPKNVSGDLILYGRDLIARTSFYLGPHGKIASLSNGMNCQNCHLDAGTKPFGNNFGSVASLYPKFRARSGKLESIEKRVNDCLERSLNGKPLDSLSKEMRAIVSYIEWLGKDVPKGETASGSGLIAMDWLSRPADPIVGEKLYIQKCKLCHGDKGEGQLLASSGLYFYPPLWGDDSFNTGAGLFRISNFSRYIRANMPSGASFYEPVLTEEEAWDIAAYVLSMPRPFKNFEEDWPKIETKPVDHPFGPFADNFSEVQHKYGPFGPIVEARERAGNRQ